MKKNLPILGFTTALLLAIAFFMQAPPGRKDLSGLQLLENVKLEAVKKIIIKKGNEQTTLIRDKEGYSIEEKDGYSADTAKTASLLVELLNMKGTEWITSKKEKLANFGLSHNNNDALTVTLLSDNDSELGGLVIGNSAGNRGSSQQSYAFGNSRYVRVKGGEDVFLVSKVTPVQAEPATWLARGLLQIKGEEIDSIAVKHIDGNDSFKLKNKGSVEFEPQNFTVPRGKKLKTYIVNNMGNALRNLRLTDSIREGNELVKNLDFDRVYTASLKDGREYQIFIAQKEAGQNTKHYLKISTSFKPVKEAETGENKEEEKEEEKTKSAPPKKDPAQVAREDGERFNGWIFEVADTSHLSYKKDDLFEDE